MALVPTVLSDRTSPTGRDRPFRSNPHVSSRSVTRRAFPAHRRHGHQLRGYQALTATLLAIATLELVISAKTADRRDRAVPHLLRTGPSQRRLIPPRFQVLPAKTSC